MVASCVVALSLFLAVTAAYALARVRFKGRSLLLLTILSVSMFPQIAVLAGLFELIRWAGVFNTPLALIFSYMIFTLPFTVWVLTTSCGICLSKSRKRPLLTVRHPGSSSRRSSCLDVAGTCDNRSAGLHRGVERVPVCADIHLVQRAAHGAGGHCPAVGQFPVRNSLGNHHAASVIVTVPLVILVLIFQRRIISA